MIAAWSLELLATLLTASDSIERLVWDYSKWSVKAICFVVWERTLSNLNPFTRWKPDKKRSKEKKHHSVSLFQNQMTTLFDAICISSSMLGEVSLSTWWSTVRLSKMARRTESLEMSPVGCTTIGPRPTSQTMLKILALANARSAGRVDPGRCSLLDRRLNVSWGLSSQSLEPSM